jgi:peptidyl-tRNA hydrolase, PTH1 family
VKLIVGLGNPGNKYESTRHNAGFLALDEMLEQKGGSWEGQKWNAAIAKLDLFGERCILLKPQTFMNLSGRSVAPAMNFYKIEPEDVYVVYDDIDMPSGKVKTKKGGGHGGHNGVRSIIKETGNSDFVRIKLGVGRPDPSKTKIDVSDWVLGKMNEEELSHLKSEMMDGVLLRLKEQFGR